MKRTLSLLCAVLICLSLCPAAMAADVTGYALYSDIRAEIDGHALRCYNIDGHAAVVAEDLRGYGFTVKWNASARTLRITRESPPPAVWPEYTPPELTHRIGERAFPVYRSNIKTYVDGKLVSSSNTGGETLIFLSALAPYGVSRWDDSTRTTSLTLHPYRPKQTLHILMYHEITPDTVTEFSDWMTTVSLFRKDLEWLRDHGYTTYLPSEVIRGDVLSDKAVMITFDDGYMSNYTLALPILREFGMKAAVSLVGSYMDNTDEGYLSWEACRALADSGLIELGSHTYDLHGGIAHRSGESREAYVQRLSEDLRRSKEIILEKTGQDVAFLAYPHGQRDSWAADTVRSLFSMTVTTAHGAAEVSRNLYGLPRYNINTRQPVSMFLR